MHGRKSASLLRYTMFGSLVCLLLVLTACDSDTSSVTPTPTSSLQFQTLNLGIPARALQAPITGPVPGSQVIHVGITFKVDPNTLKQFGGTGSASNSQSGGDVAQKLGISEQTYQNFKTYFGIENATVNLSKTRTWMTVDIQAGSVDRLLQTTLVFHKLGTRTFYTPDPAHLPKVPVQLASQILAISGLDNYSVPARPGGGLAAHLPAQTQNAQVDCSALSNKAGWNVPVLFPSDLANAYGLTSFWQKGWGGQGQKVLLVEPYDTYNQNDVNAFLRCSRFQGTFHTVTVDGVPSAPTNDFDETTLDIDMLASVAPRADIVDYQSDGYGAMQNGGDWNMVMNGLLQRIIDDYQNNTHSGTVVSISMQSDETSISQSGLAALDQSLQILTQVEHMSVFVATGDCAAFETQQYDQLAVSSPADDPWAIAVGGTNLRVNVQGNRASEVAWSNASADHSQCNNSWGTGGGISTAYPEPGWQQQNASAIPGLHNQYSNGNRQLPDVTAAATNVVAYMNGQWTYCFGTSAATPIVAGGMAVMNGSFMKTFKHFFYGPSGFYAAQASGAKYHPFYDITGGDNIYYRASPGWDYTSGLGAPNFLGYYESLQLLLKP
ncbi:MAG TPA: S53 family peptidase [Ktedonobacteraceae bacterium]